MRTVKLYLFQAIQDCGAEDLPLFIFANWRGFSGGMNDMYSALHSLALLVITLYLYTSIYSNNS
jgi:hypothetical protein